MSRTQHSYLDGAEWALRTRVQHRTDAGVILTHEASIRATAATRTQWNAHFWALFPPGPADLHELVTQGAVNVKVMFRFHPSARMKQRYGGLPVLKVARTAERWHGQVDKLPPALANAIDEYERDRRMLDAQRQQAWFELLHLRLPQPPAGYEWHLTSGDPRFYGDLLNFQLRPRG